MEISNDMIRDERMWAQGEQMTSFGEKWSPRGKMGSGVQKPSSGGRWGRRSLDS